MAKKQPIKKSEARIIILLNAIQASKSMPRPNYISNMAAKLGTDYGYMMHLLKEMHEKNWIRKEEHGVKSYYFLTKLAPVSAAKELMI